MHKGLSSFASKFSAFISNDTVETSSPLISICLVHYNRPNLLKQAIDSLLDQDFTDFEVLLGDDGSVGEESKKFLSQLEPLFKKKGWRIFRLENEYLGKTRNILAKNAKGKWLLFFDDDNIAIPPHMISTCANVANKNQPGIISLMFNVFEGENTPQETLKTETFYPMGDIISYSAINNALGDSSCLIHKNIFEKLGGFTEDYGIGHEDYELWLKAALEKVNFNIIPQPLYWYKRSGKSDSMLQATNEYVNRMRSLRPFLENNGNHMHIIVLAL